MATAVLIVSATLSVASAVYALSNIPDSAEDSGSDVVKQGTASPRNVVYGKCRVSCISMWSNVLDSNNAYLIQQFAIGGVGKFNKIHQAWIEDKQVLPVDIDLVTDPNIAWEGFCSNEYEDDGGTPVVPISPIEIDFGNNLQLQFRNGSLNERAAELATKYSDGERTSLHRGDLIPSVTTKVFRDIGGDGVVITSPQFKIEVLVSGVSVYDPRANGGAGDVIYSNNPALCIMDYLIAGSDLNDLEKYYGMSVPVEYIDIPSFAAAANFCDANSLTINTEIQSNQTFGDILEKMLSSFDGVLTVENGAITCKFEQEELAAYEFNDDNIVGNFGLTNQSTSNYNNSVEVSYKSYINDEEDDVYVIPADFYADPRIIADGYIKSSKIEMPYTIDAYGTKVDGTGDVQGAVKFMANREYTRSNFQKEVTFDIDLIEQDVKIYDVISVTNEVYGLTNHKFRVLSMKKSLNDEKLNIATIKGREYSDTIYTGTKNGNTGKPKPQPIPIAAPNSLAFTLTNFVSNGYGLFTWASNYYSQHIEYEVEYKLASVSTYTRLGEVLVKEFKVSNLRNGETYDLRVRVRDSYKGTSEWAELNGIAINSNVDLPSVTGAVVDAVSPNFQFSWDDMLGEDAGFPFDPTDPDGGNTTGTVADVFSHYRVSVSHFETGSWVFKRNYSVGAPSFLYTLEENTANSRNREVRIEVIIVAKDGSISSAGVGSTVDADNSQMGQPLGFSAKVTIGSFLAEWLPRDESDFAGSYLQVATDAGFTTGLETISLQTESLYSWIWPVGDEDDRYVRVGHFDVFGNTISTIDWGAGQLALFTTIEIPQLPDIGDNLEDIRNPEIGQQEEFISNVVSSDKKHVAGYGMYAKNGQSSRSRFVVAADDFVIGAGGHANWDATVAYVINDLVALPTSDTVTALYKAIAPSTGVTPPNGAFWTLEKADINYVGFYYDATDDRVFIENANIKELEANNIKAGTITSTEIFANTITANEIDANTITGNEISSTTTILAGSGAAQAGMNGFDTGVYDGYRFWSGGITPSTANFNVTSDGTLNATSANISGDITATTGRITGNMLVGASGSGVGMSGAVTAANDVRLWAGGSNPTTAPFRLYENGDIFANSGTFNGSVQATQIVGDVVTAKSYAVTPRTLSFIGYSGNVISGTVMSGSVSTSRPYTRSLVFGGLLLTVTAETNTDDVPASINARVRLVYAGGTFVTRDLSVTSTDVAHNVAEQSISVDNFAVDVPANTTGSFFITLEVTSNSGSTFGITEASLTSVNLTNPTIPVHLFQSGGDLS